jgi:hypothetical protein
VLPHPDPYQQTNVMVSSTWQVFNRYRFALLTSGEEIFTDRAFSFSILSSVTYDSRNRVYEE